MPWTVDRRSALDAPPIKGSRFLATVAPAADPAAALAIVEQVAAAHPRAGHHCWAFRLADGTTRVSDDGEPAGSAGRPILARIEGREAVDIVVVVSRWFGGTKLGVGGLVRAYGGCAGAALDAAVPVEVDTRIEVRIRYQYADTGAVERVLSECSAEDVSTEYGVGVVRVVRIAPADAERLLPSLTEATAGRASLDS